MTIESQFISCFYHSHALIIWIYISFFQNLGYSQWYIDFSPNLTQITIIIMVILKYSLNLVLICKLMHIFQQFYFVSYSIILKYHGCVIDVRFWIMLFTHLFNMTLTMVIIYMRSDIFCVNKWSLKTNLLIMFNMTLF